MTATFHFSVLREACLHAARHVTTHLTNHVGAFSVVTRVADRIANAVVTTTIGLHAIRARYDHSTYITTVGLSDYLTVTLMTSDKQSNGRRLEVELQLVTE